MRHRQSGRKLKRTGSHRRALLANLSTSLLRHKRIVTTVAKAKETRMLVEKMITRAKHAAVEGTTPAAAVHARREVGKMIKDRTVIKELFTTIAEKVATRPGGYTRIVRLGQRAGDGADVAVLELVDFNIGQETKEKTPEPAKRKRAGSRPRGKKAAPKAGEAVADKGGKAEKEHGGKSDKK